MNPADLAASLHKDKYRPDIDGIRAIAVTSVVLSHAFPSIFPEGFIGVDVFFVLSGYLITGIILRKISEQTFSIAGFYDRRIRRIFPALAVVLLACLLLGWLLLFRPEFLALGRHITASTLFYENILLWSEARYFDTSSLLKPTLHFWSLAIEEQFYIVWPLLLFAVCRSGQKPLAWMLAAFATSLALNI